MTNNGFIRKLNDALTVPTCYALGCFGQVMTDAVISQKKKQYPDWYNKNGAKVKIGEFGFDCICFIKAILWGWTPDHNAIYESNGVPDVTEEQMLAYCDQLSDNMDSIEAGEYLWKKGHCGIYIGGNKVIHCTTGNNWGVCVTTIGDFSPLKHGKLKWIDYSDNEPGCKEKCLDAIALVYKYVKENWGK